MLIRDYVYHALADRATDWLRRRQEDWFYGWNEDHWLGEKHEAAARQVLQDATDQLDEARCQALDTPPTSPEWARVRTAEADLHRARIRLDRTLDRIEQAIAKRRQLRVDRLVSSLFLKLYRKTQQSSWPLWGPGVPPALRTFILRWKDHPKIAPQQLVFLWLILEDTNKHAEDYGVTAVGYQDWLAGLDLVTWSMDTDARESRPSDARKDFLRQLQHREPEPAHENEDPRDLLADMPYDGPAREDSDDRCPTCQGFLRERTINVRGKYAKAIACDRYATTCRYELLTDLFSTKDALQDHLAVQALLAI